MSTHFRNDAFAELVLSIVTPELDRRDAERKPAAPSDSQLDDEALKTIRQYEIISRKPYLTQAECALYLDVSDKSIQEWAQRPDEDNPFPEERAGSAPRYNRMKVDAWVEREARLRRLARQ